MSVPFPVIGVVGAGAWGAALAQTAARAGRDVVLWTRSPQAAAALARTRESPRLPGAPLDPRVTPTAEADAFAATDAILFAAPVQAARQVTRALAAHIAPNTPLVSCAKGFERTSLKRVTQVFAEEAPQARPAVLSGPSFAGEVARGLPAAVTLAAPTLELAGALAASIGWSGFRPYLSDDVLGVEVGGAMKNVLAVACGAAEGLGLGRSAHAGLITRGFSEMTRLGAALGARRETLQGLSGLGDLVLTCSSPQSRNMSLGRALGEGRALADILAERDAVTEGVATAPAMLALADQHAIDAPICAAVNAVLDGRLTPAQAMQTLLARAVKVETA